MSKYVLHPLFLKLSMHTDGSFVCFFKQCLSFVHYTLYSQRTILGLLVPKVLHSDNVLHPLK